MLGRFSLNIAYCSAVILSLLINKEWNKETTAPSYSNPYSVLWVMGEKDFHMILSQMLIAMNNDVPEFPIPYPFDNNSSIMIIKTVENTNYIIIKMAFPAPNLSNSPYIPDHT